MSNFQTFIKMSNSKKGDSYVDAYIVRSKKNNCKATGLWEVQQTVEPLQTFLAPLATKYAKMLVDSIHRKSYIHLTLRLWVSGTWHFQTDSKLSVVETLSCSILETSFCNWVILHCCHGLRIDCIFLNYTKHTSLEGGLIVYF